MDVVFIEPSQTDYDSFTESGLDASTCLNGRIKATFTDAEGHTADLFIDKTTYERLGGTYITANTTLRYDKYTAQWMAKLSQNNYYNDLARYPEKIIPLVFDSIEPTTGREIYRNENTRWIYTREVARREPFARWMIHSPGGYLCARRMAVPRRRVPRIGWRAVLIMTCETKTNIDQEDMYERPIRQQHTEVQHRTKYL